ncbi:MAG: stage II sporulation protein M, partial [Candidatus Nitrosomaritimum aestuariumsis]
PGLADIEPLTLLYYSPYGAMELVAYSIAMSRSFLVVYSLVKKVNPKSLIKPSIIEIGIVVAILVIAGYLEEYLIQASQTPPM